MTPNGPPKLTPEGVAPEAARYLDNAAEYLKEAAETYGFRLEPYDQYHADHSAWLHGLYGKYRDRDICIQVLTDERMAADFTAILKGYVRISWRKHAVTVFPKDDEGAWLLFETRRVNGMVALHDGVAGMTAALRLACTFRLPHPTDPDSKA